MGSILAETKLALGLDVAAEGFDPELILHINSVLSDFAQLGLGPDDGFAITGKDELWEDFLNSEKLLNSARSLAYLRVKMLFDAPQTGYLLTSYEKMVEKAEWRLNIAIEEIKHPPVPNSGTVVLNPFGRDAFVEITGGLVSEVMIGDVVQTTVAGSFTVPAGSNIKLTYTKTPTWTWA